MSVHRFFVDPGSTSGGGVLIVGEDAAQIHRVLRLAPGAEIAVVERRAAGERGSGAELWVRLEAVGPREVRGRIVDERFPAVEPPVEVAVFQSAAKGDRLERVIRSCVELGASAVFPFLSGRSVARPSGGEGRLERWRRIAEEAAEQSGRLRVPVVGPVVSWPEAVSSAAERELALLLSESGGSGVREALAGRRPSRVSIMVGPEGGFTEAEAAEAARAGLVRVSMGPRVMRVETAAPTALALVMYEIGDLGGRWSRG